MSADAPESTGTRTVERALALLAYVCEHGAVTLTEAARGSDLSTSTALRLLRTLETTGFISRDDGGDYRPGSITIRLGAQALSRETIVAIAEPKLHEIVELTSENAYLGLPTNSDTVLYAAGVQGSHPVHLANWVGRVIPRSTTASGKALSGNVGDQGFAVVRSGADHDSTAIAVPVHAVGTIVATLSVVIPNYRVTGPELDRIGALLIRMSEDVSERLGTERLVTPPEGS
jgi:IclR family acetate operon transcriptional repressor